MRIEAHDRLGNPIVQEVTRVVIYNDYDHPVAVALKHGDGWMYVGHCKDPEFFDVLEMLGVKATYIVDSLDPTSLKKLSVK